MPHFGVGLRGVQAVDVEVEIARVEGRVQAGVCAEEHVEWHAAGEEDVGPVQAIKTVVGDTVEGLNEAFG